MNGLPSVDSQARTSNGRTAQTLGNYPCQATPLEPVSANKTLEIPDELNIQSDIIDAIIAKFESLTARLAPLTINGPAPDTNQHIDNRCTALGGRLFINNDRLRYIYYQLNYQLDNLAI